MTDAATATETGKPGRKTGKPGGDKVKTAAKANGAGKGKQTTTAKKAGGGRKSSGVMEDWKKLKGTTEYLESAKISILVPKGHNPKKQKGAVQYALYKDNMTVAQALEAGVKKSALVWDELHGFIKVAGSKIEPKYIPPAVQALDGYKGPKAEAA